jgi:hypothetical protein
MWLFCGGMPRSGSTLQYQLLSTLVERQGDGCRIGWDAPGAIHIKILEIQRLLGNTYKFYVMKSHAPVQAISNMVDLGTAQAFYVYRDLRDVVVSTMHKHKLGFQSVWESTTLDDAIRWGKSWELMPNVYLSRYEEMQSNMRTEVERMAEHLHLPCPVITAVEIANAHSIKNQRDITDRLDSSCQYHPTELLHKNHIGKANGNPGQWRSQLSWEQIKAIESRYGDWLVGHGYDLLVQSS